MSFDKVSLFVNTCYNRGNKALLMTAMYGKALTSTEKDELLTCSRIAKAKVARAQQRGVTCVL